MRSWLKLLFCITLIAINIDGYGASHNFDYKENSVYIYNFIKCVAWPEKKSIINIGIVGNSPVENELKNLMSKVKYANINFIIKNIGVEDSKNYDVIVVCETAWKSIKEVAKNTENMPVLIITEKENMGRQGACISFFIDEEKDYKTEYQLSLHNCRARGIKINNQIVENAILTR